MSPTRGGSARHAARALSFSSGVLAPASGLDPALRGPRRRAARAGPRSSCTASSCCAVRLDEARRAEARPASAWSSSGRHDDHHKARLPVGSLAGDRGAARGRVGRGERAGAEAEPGAGRRCAAPGARRPASTPRRRSRSSSISSRATRTAASGASSRPPAPRSASTTPTLQFYRAVATGPVIEQIAALDFVLFVELIGLTSAAHDQSMPLIDADMIRPGTPRSGSRASAAPRSRSASSTAAS